MPLLLYRQSQAATMRSQNSVASSTGAVVDGDLPRSLATEWLSKGKRNTHSNDWFPSNHNHNQQQERPVGKLSSSRLLPFVGTNRSRTRATTNKASVKESSRRQHHVVGLVEQEDWVASWAANIPVSRPNKPQDACVSNHQGMHRPFVGMSRPRTSSTQRNGSTTKSDDSRYRERNFNGYEARTRSTTTSSSSSSRVSSWNAAQLATHLAQPRLRSSQNGSAKPGSSTGPTAANTNTRPFSSCVETHHSSHTNSKPCKTRQSSQSQSFSKKKQEKKKPMRAWKSAVDAKSGRTYYYDVVTRETQWRKPIELATESERAAMLAAERKQKDFFAAMESNMLKSMAAGIVPGTPKVEHHSSSNSSSSSASRSTNHHGNASGLVPKPTLSKARLVRTISSMDHTLLQELTLFEQTPTRSTQALDQLRRVADQMSRLSISPTTGPMALAEESSSSSSSSPESPPNRKDLKQLAKPTMAKRNTCGTLYVGSTMSAPDKDATIKCVCGVYRAHIVDSSQHELGLSLSKEEEFFNDFVTQRPSITIVEEEENNPAIETEAEGVPSLDEICSFYRNVFSKAQMESDCIIMSLVYVERLYKMGKVRPRIANWRSILFSCMILSSKVWDDLSMWNADFSQTCPPGVTFSLERINQLELHVLRCLDYNVKVLASEYAKYYFLLRSMVIRSGLAGDDLTSPLDVEGAKKLELASANFGKSFATGLCKTRRAKSLNQEETSLANQNVSLEHMVPM